jgi:hypothetical protein
MSNVEFDVTIKGPGLDYQSKVSSDAIAQLISICLSSGIGLSAISPKQIIKQDKPTDTSGWLIKAPASGSPFKSVAEYFNEFTPKRNPDKILTFANYEIDIKGKESFEPEELKPYFQKCGEITPKNYSRDFRWAIANGWFDECQNMPGQFYVTGTGKAVLKANFSEDMLKKTKAPKAKPRKKLKKEEIAIGE